jgi:hypothetical protein
VLSAVALAPGAGGLLVDALAARLRAQLLLQASASVFGFRPETLKLQNPAGAAAAAGECRGLCVRVGTSKERWK